MSRWALAHGSRVSQSPEKPWASALRLITFRRILNGIALYRLPVPLEPIMTVTTLLRQKLTPAWCLTLLYGLMCAGIIVAANIPAARNLFASLKQVPCADKIAHFFLIGILSLLLNSALNAATVRFAGRTFLKGNLFLVVLATVEELSNLIQPHRTCSWMDLLFNYLGIFAFGWLSLVVVQKSRARAEARLP